jgi:hypothetical protein
MLRPDLDFDLIPDKQVYKWFRGQDRFAIRADLGSEKEVYIVEDKLLGIANVREFDDLVKARRWVYDMHHTFRLLETDFGVAAKSSYEIRQYLLQSEKDIAKQLGRGGVTERQSALLQMMLEVTRSAISRWTELR